MADGVSPRVSHLQTACARSGRRAGEERDGTSRSFHTHDVFADAGCRWARYMPKDVSVPPFVKLSEARNESERGELYHPVKSADVFRELIA